MRYDYHNNHSATCREVCCISHNDQDRWNHLLCTILTIYHQSPFLNHSKNTWPIIVIDIPNKIPPITSNSGYGISINYYDIMTEYKPTELISEINYPDILETSFHHSTVAFLSYSTDTNTEFICLRVTHCRLYFGLACTNTA